MEPRPYVHIARASPPSPRIFLSFLAASGAAQAACSCSPWSAHKASPPSGNSKSWQPVSLLYLKIDTPYIAHAYFDDHSYCRKQPEQEIFSHGETDVPDVQRRFDIIAGLDSLLTAFDCRHELLVQVHLIWLCTCRQDLLGLQGLHGLIKNEAKVTRSRNEQRQSKRCRILRTILCPLAHRPTVAW